MPTGGVDIIAGAGALAGAFGSAAPFIGAGLAGAEGGAALGGLTSAITGGNIGQGILHGAEGGALTGGGIGLAGGALGGTIGTTAADVLGGAAGGALGGVVTGNNPLTGAIEGGISGGIASQFSGTPSTSSAAPAAGGAGTSAAGAAAPSGIPAELGGDVTQSFPTDPNNLPSLSGTGSPATASTNIGTGTTGTQSLPGGLGDGNLGSQISQAAGGQSVPTGPLPDLGATTTPAAPTSVDNFLAKPGVGTAFDVVKANPGAAISAAGLGIDALKQGQALEGENQLKSEAGQLAGQGQQLQNYLQSGTLPPGLQTGIDQASEAAKATIRSQYASRGLSGSSSEQQELAAVDQRAQAQGAQMAMQLLQTGISETGVAAGLYEQLLNNATANDKELGSAISNFASAAGGGGGISGRGGKFELVQQ